MEVLFLVGFGLLSALVVALLVRSGKTRPSTIGTAIVAATLTVIAAVVLGNAAENEVEQVMAGEEHEAANYGLAPSAIASERSTRMTAAEEQAHLLWGLALLFGAVPVLGEIGLRRLLRDKALPARSETERIARLLVIVVLAVVGVGTGVILSQYAPVFGGFETFGRPWSPARQGLIGTHALAFGFVGALLGALLAFGLPPRASAQPPRASDVESRLKELEALREKGVLTDDEYKKKRADIVGTI